MIEIRWNPSRKDLRDFGLVILIGFGLIGLAKVFWPFSWGIVPNVRFGGGLIFAAVVIGVPAILGSRLVLPAYWAWMGIAVILHKIMFPVMFGAFYYLVFFPIGMIMRLVGHDPLKLKRSVRSSYWIPLHSQAGPEDYERQY